MALDISSFSKPIAIVDLSSGRLFLYGMRVQDLTALSRLPKSAAPRQKLLTSISCLASRMDYDKETQPKPTRLSQTEVEALPEDDLSQIARAMLEPSYFNRLWSVSRDALPHRPPDIPAEPYDERIAKIVDWLLADRVKQEEKFKKLVDRSSFGAVHDWIKQTQRLQNSMNPDIEAMRRALGDIDTGALAETKRMLDAQEELRKSMEPIDALRSSAFGSTAGQFIDSPAHYVDPLADIHRTIRNERQQELDYARTMADAAVTSTRVLKKLSEDFFDFMERFTSAAGASEMGQQKSLKYVIWTFAGGVLVALVALVVTAMSYSQDKDTNRNNDAWQERIEVLMKQRASTDVEVEELRRQNRTLSARVEALEAKPREKVKSTLGAH